MQSTELSVSELGDAAIRLGHSPILSKRSPPAASSSKTKSPGTQPEFSSTRTASRNSRMFECLSIRWTLTSFSSSLRVGRGGSFSAGLDEAIEMTLQAAVSWVEGL